MKENWEWIENATNIKMVCALFVFLLVLFDFIGSLFLICWFGWWQNMNSVPSMYVWQAELRPCFTIPVCIIIMPTSAKTGGGWGFVCFFFFNSSSFGFVLCSIHDFRTQINTNKLAIFLFIFLIRLSSTCWIWFKSDMFVRFLPYESHILLWKMVHLNSINRASMSFDCCLSPVVYVNVCNIYTHTCTHTLTPKAPEIG